MKIMLERNSKKMTNILLDNGEGKPLKREDFSLTEDQLKRCDVRCCACGNCEIKILHISLSFYKCSNLITVCTLDCSTINGSLDAIRGIDKFASIIN